MADGSGAKDCYLVALVHDGILDAVIRGAEHIGQEERLLVRDVVGYLQQIHVPKRHAHILRLPARKPAREMRVPKEPRRPSPVHGFLNRIPIRRLTLRREPLLAVVALPARDLEACDVALPWLDLFGGDAAANVFGHAAELLMSG